MARQVTLDIRNSAYILGKHNGTRIRIEVTAAVGMQTQIFAYRVVPAFANQAFKTAQFSHVCGATNLEDYPAGLPISDAIEFFRLAYVDVFLHTPEEALEFRELIEDDVLQLQATLNVMAILVNPQTVVIP